MRARDWRVIHQLAARGPLTNSELAQAVGMDAATITRVVKNLVHLHLVTVQASPTDRRKQIVRLTADGVEVHNLIAPRRRRAGEAMMACLGAKERASLFAILDKLDSRMRQLEVERSEAPMED